MRHTHRSFLPGLIVLLLLFGFVAPPGPAAAQEFDCPEGLVYNDAAEICLPPEEVPAEEEPVEAESVDEAPPDEPVDDPTDDVVDDGSDGALDEEATDDGDMTGDAVEPTDGDLEDPAIDAPAIVADEAAPIKNLTLLTFACPINWNPATRDIEDSREMCTEPIVPNMTYTVLFEGQELTRAGLRTDVDLAQDLGLNGVPLPPGMYTIRENLQEGLEDPFAFCAIYAADGASRLTVAETVPGGSLDILLAAGEEVNCEWYSVATVPEVAAAPALGLDLRLFSCPAPAEFNGGLDECTLPHPGPIAFEFSYGGQVLETGTVSPPEFTYDLDKDAPLSGEWTIRPILPEGWIDPHFTCTNGDITAGASISDARFFPPVDGSLGVTVQLNPDQRVQCQIWLFAGDVRESVVVVTRDCPEDYDAATLSPGVRKATCPGLQFQDVSVTVGDAAPVLGESTRNGVAAFPTQPGLWRIAADPGLGVVGRAVTFVTCDHTFAALGQVQTIEPTINTDQRSVSIDLDEGDALRCDFFFGPAPAAAAEAPVTGDEGAGAGEEPAAGDEAAMEEPEVAPAEEAATGTGEGTDPPDTTQPETGGANDPAEGATEGGSFGGGGQAVQVVDTAAQDGAPEGAASDPAAVGTASLAIQHWDCPAAIAPEATVDSLIETCTASLQPSGWTLNGNPLEAGDGYAVWEGLPLGPVSVSNGAASGKDDAASSVSCSLALTDVDDPLIGVEAAVRGGAIELVFDQPSVVYCNWFVGP